MRVGFDIMEIFGGLRKLAFSTLSALITYLVSSALFEWFNAYMEAEIAQQIVSINSWLRLLKNVAGIMAFDVTSFVLAIIAAVITFIKVASD